MQSLLRQNLSDADFLMAVNHKAEIFNEFENKSIKIAPIPHIHLKPFILTLPMLYMHQLRPTLVFTTTPKLQFGATIKT